PGSGTPATGCSERVDPLDLIGVRARSSGGQSTRLIIEGSQVQVLPGPLDEQPADPRWTGGLCCILGPQRRSGRPRSGPERLGASLDACAPSTPSPEDGSPRPPLPGWCRASIDPRAARADRFTD